MSNLITLTLAVNGQEEAAAAVSIDDMDDMREAFWFLHNILERAWNKKHAPEKQAKESAP